MQRFIVTVAVGAAFVIALVATMGWPWDRFTRGAPHAKVANGELWLDAIDVAAGETIAGRVRLRGGLRLWITQVRVSGFAGEVGPTRVYDWPVDWGDRIDVSASVIAGVTIVDERGENHITFPLHVPATTAPGERVLTVDVGYAVATKAFGGYRREDRETTFRVPLAVHSPAGSIARRGVKGLAAIAAATALLVVTVRTRRRRGSAAGAAMYVAGLAAGFVVMTRLGGQALRVHGAWWSLTCLLVPVACVAIGLWSTRGVRVRRYRLVAVRDARPEDEAARPAGAQPSRTFADLERAWRADGLTVERRAGHVIVRELRGKARVPVVGGALDGSTPVELRCDDAGVVERLARVASGVLGEVRIERIDEDETPADFARATVVRSG